MHYLIVFLFALFISGCTEFFNQEDIQNANELCKEHQGLKYGRPDHGARNWYEITAVCQDGIVVTKRTRR